MSISGEIYTYIIVCVCIQSIHTYYMYAAQGIQQEGKIYNCARVATETL